MKKVIALLFIFVVNAFAYWCPVGCLDGYLQNTYIQTGKNNYNMNDQNMLNSFTEMAEKMRTFYQDFENVSSEMLEKNARLQYMESVFAKNITFESNKMTELESLEFDSQAIKTKKNIEVKIK